MLMYEQPGEISIQQQFIESTITGTAGACQRKHFSRYQTTYVGELHYLPLKYLDLLSGRWSETPGLFRPEQLLDLLFKLNSCPLDDMFKHFAIFVWLPESSVVNFFFVRNRIIFLPTSRMT